MERLFKILRSKFDRFEQTPPDGAFDKILSSLVDEDDNKSKRRVFGGHGFLLFSSLVAITTLAGTFILNKSNFDVALNHNGSHLSKSQLSLVTTNGSVHHNGSTEAIDHTKENVGPLIGGTNYQKSIKDSYATLGFLPSTDGKSNFLYNRTEVAAANYLSFFTTHPNTSEKAIDLLATNNINDKTENIESVNSVDKTLALAKQKRKRARAKAYAAKKRKARRASKYKYTGKQSFEVKDPFSVYGQKSKQGYYLDSVELAEIEQKKKEELEAENPVMEEAKILEPKFAKTTSRLTLSLAVDKLYYVSAVKQDVVKTENFDLINYKETGATCQQSVNIHYSLNKNIELLAGIGHRSFQSIYEADWLKDSVKVSFIDPESTSPTEEEIRKPLYNKGKNQSHFLSLPIGINYNSNVGKLKVFAGFGLNTNILLSSKQHLSTKFKQNDELIKNNTKNIVPVNKISFALNPSLGIVYPIGNRLDLSIGTSGLFYVSNLYAGNELKSSPVLLGGNVGIRFRMN